jgi:molybdopterin-dependent oxidoreductase-like protein protein
MRRYGLPSIFFPVTMREYLVATMLGAICAVGLARASLAKAPPAKASSEASVADRLVVVDEAGVEHSLARKDFLRLDRQKVKGKTHAGEAEFEGPSLVELLKSVGVKFGEDLKGKRAPTVAVCDAADGYRVVITLLEIDPATTDRVAIVADTRDGKPLDAKQGPYRLVIPSDNREIRWIRNLQEIQVTNLKNALLESLRGK